MKAPSKPAELEIQDVEWVKVGVPGFDELLVDGIPKGSSILVSGGCGTGKTIFCLQSLWSGLQNNEKCLYISFEESENKLIHHMLDFGWDPRQYIKNGSFMVKTMEPMDLSVSIKGYFERKRSGQGFDVQISDLIPEGFKPDRIVIDSVSALEAAFTGQSETYRMYTSQLFRYFEKINSTAFLISETEQMPTTYSKEGVDEFLSDGVFVFYNIRQRDVIVRALEVRKIRGAEHAQKIAPFKIVRGEGITVYPQESVFTEKSF